MKPKHTPGPWDIATVDNGESNDEIVAEINGCIVNIAEVFGEMTYTESTIDGRNEPEYHVTIDEVKANASLIAAAPDLLAALERLCRSCDGDSLGVAEAPAWAILCSAQSAIARAKGE